jgi:arylsulfatase A-like enzyme
MKRYAIGFLIAISCASSVSAYEPDAVFADSMKKNKQNWSEEDTEVTAQLAQLRRQFGRVPNVVLILADDIGWGELGSFLGGKLRGTPTPNLDDLAEDGLTLLSHYSEPSCTPTRLALLTGRYPVRTGVTTVLWPGQGEGLSPDEVTVAEILSEVGYETAMFGKWHVGDGPQQGPENQGFDYSYYGLYNGAIYSWANQKAFYEADTIDGAGYFYDFPGSLEDYESTYGIEIKGILEARKGEGRREIAPIGPQSMADIERNSILKIKDFISENAQAGRPFFVYWASYAQQMASSPIEYRFSEGVDSQNNQAAQLAQHDDYIGQLRASLRDNGVEENTLLIWISDNGPMYAFWPNSGYSWLRGGKGDVYEGGVRTPGFAVWPGVIAPDQTALDMVSVTDLLVTLARVAGATQHIPNDRVIDGIDQLPLFLQGEGHGRRDFLFHYSGSDLAAVRMGQLKMHLAQQSRGGLPNFELYNLKRDPGEKFGEMFNHLWAVVPFQNLIGKHRGQFQQFPHRQ